MNIRFSLNRFCLRGACVAAALALPLAAQADPAFTRNTVNLRAGPSTDYPAVVQLRPGQPLEVVGCTHGYSWCDVVLPDGLRGWVAASLLDYPWGGTPVPLAQYGAAIGVPLLTFSLGSYWSDHYRDRPWYREQRWWGQRRPPPPISGWRPPPPPPVAWQPRPPRPDWRPPPSNRPPNWQGRPDRPPGWDNNRPDRPPGWQNRPDRPPGWDHRPDRPPGWQNPNRPDRQPGWQGRPDRPQPGWQGQPDRPRPPNVNDRPRPQRPEGQPGRPRPPGADGRPGGGPPQGLPPGLPRGTVQPTPNQRTPLGDRP